jgi:hypothetical protein
MPFENLFNIDPLELGGEGPSEEDQLTINEKLDRVNVETEKSIDKIRDKGIFARYPVIESPEDEAKERSRLLRRGLKLEEVDRRIEKFKKKGGKIKTSSKLMTAAGLFAGGIEGYLSTKQGRRVRGDQGLVRLQKEAKASLDEEIAKVEKLATEEKALILQEDEREFQVYLTDLKDDAAERKQLAREARSLGVPMKDEAGKALPLEDVARAVTAENARQAQRKEELEQQREARLQTSASFTKAAQAADASLISDEDLAAQFNIPPDNQDAVDAARSSLDAAFKLKSFIQQSRVESAALTTQQKQKAVDAPPRPAPQTPEEKAEAAAEERAAKRREKAIEAYSERIGDMVEFESIIMQEQDKGNETDVNELLAIRQGQLAQLAELLNQIDPDLYPTLKEAQEKIVSDMSRLGKAKAQFGNVPLLGSQLKRAGE